MLLEVIKHDNGLVEFRVNDRHVKFWTEVRPLPKHDQLPMNMSGHDPPICGQSKEQ